jgi:hypothetical protein
MRRPRPWESWLASLALAVTGGASAAWGGDDIVLEEGRQEQPEETVRFQPMNVHVLGGPVGRVVEYDLEAMFDQQLFGGGRGTRQVKVVGGRMVVEVPGESGAPDTLARLAGTRAVGEQRIATLTRVCGIMPRQQAILRMAVESDLRRVAGEIDAARRNYAGQRMPATAQGLDRERLQRLRDEAVACRRQIDRLWQTGSLFASVSLGMLSPEQRVALEDWLADRRAVRWEAMVRLVLGQFDETVLGLSDQQHAALLEPLLADLPPLVVFEGVPPGSTLRTFSNFQKFSNFQTLLVSHRLGRLDRAALRPLFDPRQWAALETLLTQHGEAAAVARLLVEQGILEHAGEDD